MNWRLTTMTIAGSSPTQSHGTNSRKTTLAALRSLDRKLDQMSGEANSGNWTIGALRSYDCWRDVRKLAVTALAMRQIAKVKKPAP